MLDEEAPQELEAFVIPAKEHGVVLFSLLEGPRRTWQRPSLPFPLQLRATRPSRGLVTSLLSGRRTKPLPFL